MSNETVEKLQSYRELALVLGALLVLTAVTVTASRLDLGPLRVWVALLIAAAKATLVLIFFMQIKKAGRAVTYTFAITIVTLAIFISFIFFDIAYR